MPGKLVSIHLRTSPGKPVQEVSEVEAVAGTGLIGNHDAQPGCEAGEQATLIEAEALEAIAQEAGIELEAGASRRNLLTRGVALNHLVGREFTVGAVRMRGIELCEPCSLLQALTQPGILKALVHRGGLRAEVLASGTLRPGDPIVTE